MTQELEYTISKLRDKQIELAKQLAAAEHRKSDVINDLEVEARDLPRTLTPIAVEVSEIESALVATEKNIEIWEGRLAAIRRKESETARRVVVERWNGNQIGIYERAIRYNDLVEELNKLRDEMISLNAYRISEAETNYRDASGAMRRYEDLLFECIHQMPGILDPVQIYEAHTFENYLINK